MIIKFEEYLEKSSQAQTPAELFNVLLKTVSQHGYDRILFALLTDHRDIEQSAGVGVMENYPEDWMKFYHEKGLSRIDPIVTYGVHQVGAFKWNDISSRTALKKTQLECLNQGGEAGLHNGISVPLRGPSNQMAGVSLATSLKRDACADNNADLITAYCQHFYIAYKRMHKKDSNTFNNIILTKKEKEVLTWAAVGKSDDEIGIILNMSKHTVNMHFRGIYKKMDANNRTLSVVKALSMGMIHP